MPDKLQCTSVLKHQTQFLYFMIVCGIKLKAKILLG